MTGHALLMRTGGTIDAEPYDDPKSPPQYVRTLSAHHSFIAGIVATAPNPHGVTMHLWDAEQEAQFVKDSQHFTASDMAALARIIRDSDSQYVILTHGTDGMATNACALQHALGESPQKTVLFMGAMVPLSMHQKHGSDGVASLQHALAHIASLAAGVHVLAYRKHDAQLAFFNPNTIQKDRAASVHTLQFILA